jgi:hypothetical protein
MKAKYSWTALLLASVICFSSSAYAATSIYIPTGSPSNAVNTGGMTAGGLFRRTTDAAPITFNSLGFIDLDTNFPTLLGPDGISGTYQVSLWRIDTYTQTPPMFGPVVPTSWTLLASTTITPASPLGEGFNDDFRYNSIPPTTINPGDYFIIGATLPTGPLPDKWLSGAAPANYTGFTGAGTGFTLSSGVFSPGLGPGTLIANASTEIFVPEPASLSLLAMAGLTMLRRRGLERPDSSAIGDK